MSIINITLNNYSIKTRAIEEVCKNPQKVKAFFKDHNHAGLASLRDLGFNFDVAVEEGTSMIRTAQYYAHNCAECTKSIETDVPLTSTTSPTKKRKITFIKSPSKPAKCALIKPSSAVRKPMQVSGPDFEELPLPKGKAAIWEDWEW